MITPQTRSDSLFGWGGDTPNPNTYDAFGVSISAPTAPISEPLRHFFSAYGPKETCLRNGVQFVDGDVKFYSLTHSLTPRLTAVGSEGLRLSVSARRP